MELSNGWNETLILAHRGNRNGPEPLEENTFPALQACLQNGWGVETDLRRASNGRLYISHDVHPADNSSDALTFFEMFRKYPSCPIAINVKELGYEAVLAGTLRSAGLLEQAFLFDMELLEENPGHAALILRSHEPRLRLAARVSDRDETVERALGITSARIIWLDEFDDLWVKESIVRQLKEAGREVFAVSPELHGFSLRDARLRWAQFMDWGVDGICTDYPHLLADVQTESTK